MDVVGGSGGSARASAAESEQQFPATDAVVRPAIARGWPRPRRRKPTRTKTRSLDTSAADDAEPAAPPPGAPTPPERPQRKPGKQPGTPGVGRTQRFTAQATEAHRPAACHGCQASLAGAAAAVCYTGFQSLDLVWGNPTAPGVRLRVVDHRFFEAAATPAGTTPVSSPCRSRATPRWRACNYAAAGRPGAGDLDRRVEPALSPLAGTHPRIP